MKKIFFLFIFGILLIGLVSAAQNMFEEYSGVNDNMNTCTSARVCSMGIMIRNDTLVLSNISLKFNNNLGSKGNYTIIIRSNDNTTGFPVGVTNLSVGSLLITDAGGSSIWYNFSMTAYTLANNTNYSILLYSNDSRQIRFGGDYSPQVYMYGHTSYSDTGGASWINNPGGVNGYGHYFQLYGTGTTIVLQATVSLEAPVNNTQTTQSNYLFSANYTGSSVWKNFTNTTLYVWYQNGSLFNTNYSTNDDNLNITNLSLSNIPLNTFLWNYKVCGQNTSNNFPCFWDVNGNRTFRVLAFTESLIQFNTVSYETKRESFLLNITANQTISGASFIYNGNIYTATLSSYAGGNYSINSSLNVPLASINENNYSFYWTLNFPTFSQSTNVYGQNVSRTYFINCNGTYTTPYINYSFKDEVTTGIINASIPTSSFTYWITGGSGSVNRTYTFANNSENWAYAFCFYPTTSSINLIDSIQYKQSDYPQRISSSIRTLSNSVLNKVLYLLNSVDGIFVTFQVLGGGGNPLTGVEATVNRTIGSSVETIVAGTTGSDGGVTFWLNPDLLHTFLFVKTGVGNTSFNLFPTQPLYTITLGGAVSSSTTTDYSRGISIFIKPANDYLTFGKNYSFNYTIGSSYWSLDGFGFTLKYQNGTIINTQSSTSTGILEFNFNQTSKQRVLMDYYYIVNSTYLNYTRSWIVSSSNEFSISHFFSDLSLYIGANIFGISGEDGNDDFGKAIISVLILIIVTGTLSYRYGIASEAAVMGAVFGVVLFLNNMNFIPNPSFITVGRLGDFITYIIGIILVASIVKEETH